MALLAVLATKIFVLAVGYLTVYLNSVFSADPLSTVGSMFTHWDANTYLDIAKNGYINSGDQATYIVFFPLYPFLIRLFGFNLESLNFSALIISNVASLIGFFYLYKLAKLEFNNSVAAKAVLFLSVFPTAYFLSAPYTEALFFALIIPCLYYARIGKWYFAGILSFLAALTRIAGLILLPVLLVEYFHQRGWNPKNVRLDVLWIFSALAGFSVYLYLNRIVTGNAFTFITVEATHWYNKFDPISGLKAAFEWAQHHPYPDNIIIGAAPICFAVFGLLMVVVAVWRRLRPSYTLYMLLSWGLAVSTAWWIRVPRYILAMFPMFLLLGALAKTKASTIAVVVVSGIALCYFTVIFALGWWAF
jgi:Gpi18-like mannosyltransferase